MMHCSGGHKGPKHARRAKLIRRGQASLSVALSMAMTLSLIPAQAITALADEPEVQEEAIEQDEPVVEEQAVEASSEEVTETTPEQEETPEPAEPGAASESEPESQPQKTPKKAPALKAPLSSTAAVEVSYGSEEPKDGIYQSRTINLKVTPTGEGVTLLAGTKPTVVLTYIDDNHDDHDVTFSSVSDWVVAADGLSATCSVKASETGNYFRGVLKDVQTSDGATDVEFGFGADGFDVVTMPTASKVWLQDSEGNWFTEEGISEYYNVINHLEGATAENPVVKDAKTIVVKVKGALDTKETIEHRTQDESKSYAVLVNEGGKEIAAATFKRVSDGEYEATFTRKGDNEVEPEFVNSDNYGPLPEGPIGIKIVALDTFGTQLTSTIAGNVYDYALIAAAPVSSGGEMKPMADGAFVLDDGAPVITFATGDDDQKLNYPHDKAVVKAGDSVEGLPVEAATTDIFDQGVSIIAIITDGNLDMTASTVDGRTFAQLIAAGNDGIEEGGVTYKVKNLGTEPGVSLEVVYADGVHALPKIVAKDQLHETTYDAAAELGGTVDQFIVDDTIPEVTGAAIGSTPVSQSTDSNNRVFFFKSGENAPLKVRVVEKGGIKSVKLSADGYTISPSVQGKLDEVNKHLVDPTFDGVYELQVIDTLLNEVELSDSMTVTITDFAGNERTWSFTETGSEQHHANGTEAEVENADAFYEAIGGTPFYHPTILIEDDIKPVLTLTGPQDRTDAVAPGYERVFDDTQEVSLKVVEFNMRYLRDFMAGAEGDTNVNENYVGIEPGREVMTITHRAPDGAITVRTVTAADLTFSENTVYTWSDVMAEDGDYKIKAKVVDAAGNESVEQVIADFTIDTTAPVITVDWDPADSAAVNGGYFNSTRTADVTVEEANFDPNLFEVEVKASRTPSSYVPFVYNPSDWQDNGDGTYTYPLNLDTDGRYSVGVSGQDKAGNKAEYDGSDLGYATDWFYIDTEGPVIAKYVNSDESYDPADFVIVMPERTGEYGGVNYYSSPFDLVAKVKDRNFNMADTRLDGAEVSWTTGELDEDGYETHEYTKSFTADGEYQTPHIVAYDMAENTSDNAADVRDFVIDLEAPTVKVSSDREPVSQGTQGSSDPYNFYNGATTLTITVSDAHALKDVKLEDADGYTASWDKNPLGEKQVVGTVSLREYGSAADEFDRAIILRAIDIAGNERTWSIDHNGTVKQVQGPSEANASINDNGEHPVLLVKDTTAPVVGLSGATAGEYYNTPQTVVATVNELLLDYLQMFDGGRVIVTVTMYEASPARTMTSWTIPASSFSGSKPNYSFSQPFNEDGHYVVTAQFRDYAENLSNQATIGEFTIDMTPPQLSMEFDNNDVRNEMYYKATRTATITVVEHNFDPSLFTIETEGAIGEWTTNGDTHTCTVFFDEGGPYTITVNGKDLAGNEATEVSEPEFIVDLTAPEIEIAGTAQRLGYVGDDGNLTNAYHDKLEDKSAYNGVVVPVITYKDNEVLSADDLAHTLSGSKHGDEVEHDSFVSDEDKEMTVTLRDMGYVGQQAGDGSNWENFYVDDYDVDSDDIYTIKATMTDQAGNEAEAELTFSVNRYGSNYDVKIEGMSDEELEEYERSGMVPEAPTIVVREVNVSGVADQDEDGNIVPDNHHVEKEFANATTAIKLAGDEGAGYDLTIVNPKNAENGWSEYVYTVRSANFGEGSDSDHNDRGQGIYRVNVMSDDTSSNANTTADYWGSDERRTQVTAEGATAEFVLDELGPVIDEIDLPEHISRGESYEASFHVTDDITSGNIVEVEVDGRKLDAGQIKGPGNGAGTFTFTIPAKAFNWHRSVKITVTDYAGRVVSERNHTWAWQSTFIPEAMTALGAAAVAVAGVVFARKRKEAAEPELPE